MKRNKLILTIALFAAFYFGTKWEHRFRRPWAYSNDSVLIGKWDCQFRDPDGIVKQMIVEIDEPEEEGIQSTYHYQKFDEAHTFKGHAQITSKLGTENDRIRGGLTSDDGHDIDHISFSPMDESKQVRESFNVSYTTPGKWEGDKITVSLMFTYRTKTGSGYSDSSDPRYKKVVPVVLRRVKG